MQLGVGIIGVPGRLGMTHARKFMRNERSMIPLPGRPAYAMQSKNAVACPAKQGLQLTRKRRAASRGKAVHQAAARI